MTLPCGNPAPVPRPKVLAGEVVLVNDGSSQNPRPVMPFVLADGTTNRCFKAILFRNEAAIPVAQCCSEDFFNRVESVCPVPNNPSS